MKLRMVTVAKQRIMPGSSPVSTWPGSRYTSATARTVVCSPARESARPASRAGNTALPGPAACQRSHSRARPAVSARSAGSTPASRGSAAAGPAACTRPVIPRCRRIWRRAAARRLRQGAAAGIGRHQADVHQDLVAGERVAAHTAGRLIYYPHGQGPEVWLGYAGRPAAQPIAGTWHLLLALTGEPRQLFPPRAGRGWRWPLPGWANVPRRADLRICTAAGCGGELDGMGDLGLPCPGRSRGRYAVA
jgi:hypothetical protein